MIRSHLSVLCAGSLALALTSTAMCDFVVPDGTNVPWTRGVTANSAWAQWESFTSGSGPNAPTDGSFAGGTFADGAPAWNAFDTGGFGMAIGSGNLYAAGGPLAVQIDVPNFGLGAGATTTVLLQIRTQGTEVDLSSVNIGGVAATEVTELQRVALGGFGGFSVDTLWRFELAGNASAYSIRFNALGAHMSLDRVSIDTFTQVPGPGAALLGALGGLAAPRRRRSA